MPSSDRFEEEDRHRKGETPALAAGKAARGSSDASRTIRCFESGEPWDARSAEALTQLYESAEGDPRKYATAALPRQGWQGQQAAAAPEQLQQTDRAWLEGRLAEIAGQLQNSLATLDPDKTLAPLSQRIDRIEERFSEALAGVAQRADFDGLRLIEAHVMEFAGHLEQTRARLDQIGAIDGQLRDLARRFDEGDNRRLQALETLLQDYVAEWRRSEARTSSTLTTLEETVARMGDTVEAMEASRPAPDLSLSILGFAEPDQAKIASDPLSQVYAEGSRALGPRCYRSPLDAADYAPKPVETGPPPLPALEPYPPVVEAPAPVPDADAPARVATGLAPPALRASGIRARVRQAQVLNVEAGETGSDAASGRPPQPALARDPAQPGNERRSRPGLLLAAGATLFAALGYLLVDAFMGPPSPGPSPRTSHSAPGDPKSARAEAMSLPPDAQEGKQEKSPPPASAPGRWRAPEVEDVTTKSRPAPKVEAFSGAIAALFRSQAEEASRPNATAAKRSDAAPPDEAAAPPAAALPLTIGPASLRQAAAGGDPAAQFEIAARYAAGQSVTKDLPQALLWYGRAAAKGFARAQFRLAAMHERGQGTAADPERARVWYARAAEQGHVKAMHNLAVLSISGGRSDYASAAKWFEQAAEHGLADSQFNLAVLHHNGLGVPKNLGRAYLWLTLAARSGDAEAANRALQIKSQLAAGDAAAADAAVADWRPRQPDPAVNEAATGT